MSNSIATSTPLGFLTATIGEDPQYPEIIIEIDGFQIARVSYYGKDTSHNGESYLAASVWTDGGWDDPEYWKQIPSEDVLRWKQATDR